MTSNVSRRHILRSVTKLPSKAKIPLGSSRHVLTRHDTFDVPSASRRAYRAVLFDKLDVAKSARVRHVERVVSCVSRRDVTSQVELGLIRDIWHWRSLVWQYTLKQSSRFLHTHIRYGPNSNPNITLDIAFIKDIRCKLRYLNDIWPTLIWSGHFFGRMLYKHSYRHWH